MGLYYLPGFLGTGTEFGTVQTITVTSTDHGNLAGLGDDDHTQYGAIAQNETVSGSWTFNGATTFGNTATFSSRIAASGTPDIGATGARFSTGWFSNLNLDSFIDLTEIADPAAPGANAGRLYTRDDGAGKTQLMARWPDGSTSVIATQP